MGDAHYAEALKMGKKEYRSRVSRGEFPYLPVLDQIIEENQVQTEQYIGLVQVPLDYVVGTSTMGRTYAFASNFMPILEDSSEFAMKWASLSDAQINEGIRDPIKAYEYMNRYYVVEGNKRVSVLKYFNAVSIPAIVTRKVPKLTEDEDVKLYYEYMEFNRITGLFTVEFSKLGFAELMLQKVGVTDKWDDETREKFNKVLFYFTKAFEFRGGDRLPITTGDALLLFMNVYGFDELLDMTGDEYNENVLKVWAEFGALAEEESVDLVLAPSEIREKKSLLSYFIPKTQKKFKVAFLYPREPETSAWLYSHELGRNYLEETFSDQLETMCITHVNEKNVENIIEDAIAQGAKIIFCVAPQLMNASLKVAIEHPEVYILNCSLNAPHPNIRTYYGRMYEAKFLSGMIAGAMTDNDKIAYIADYPLYGMISNINAFALGVAAVNPRARVHLVWSTKKGYDRDVFLKENNIHVVSDQDNITPTEASRHFGLYELKGDKVISLAMPLWNWGVFYEKLLQSILAGAYQSEGESENKAINYWWGFSAGVVDMVCSNQVPYGVRLLVSHMSDDIESGHIDPFYGVIYDQEGRLRNKDNHKMEAMDIMNMDWLCENVIGDIPSMDELIDKARPIVDSQGLEETRES